MGRPRVLLADDHQAILAQVRATLAADFKIIGVVINGQDAVTEVRRLDPDVLVIDISMSVLDGLQAASQLRAKSLWRCDHGQTQGQEREEQEER